MTDARIRGLAHLGYDPVEICCRLMLSWGRVARVLEARRRRPTPDFETAADGAKSEAAQGPEPDFELDAAIVFLRSRGCVITRAAGVLWFHGREIPPADVIAKAARKRRLLAAWAAE